MFVELEPLIIDLGLETSSRGQINTELVKGVFWKISETVSSLGDEFFHYT